MKATDKDKISDAARDAKEIFTGENGQTILADLTNVLSEIGGGGVSPALSNIKGKLDRYVDLLKKEFLIGEDDGKQVREYVYRILNKDVAGSEKTAFIFGAGVSAQPFKIPNWPKLLERAIIGLFYRDFIVDDIECWDDKEGMLKNEKALLHVLKNNDDDFFNGMDVYELAQYIENGLRERNRSEDDALKRSRIEMFESVRSVLYSDLPSKYRDEIKLDDDFKQSLLRRLCVASQYPHIGRIITYNYDDLFEAAWEATGQKNIRKLNSVCADEQLSSVRENNKNLTIYHVHGLVPHYEKGKCWRSPNSRKCEDIEDYLNSNENDSEALRLILSERSYDDMSHASYKWRNIIQIDTFLRYNCIFLGFSATDKNFKRITKLMDWHLEDEPDSAPKDTEKIHPKHYIFFCIDEMIKQIFGLPMLKEDMKELQDELQELANDPKMLIARVQFFYYTLRMKRKYLKRFHIYPVWTTTSNISNLIGALTGSIK